MTDLLVALQNGCCGYGVNEEEGSLTVCAEILTASTDATYTLSSYTKTLKLALLKVSQDEE